MTRAKRVCKQSGCPVLVDGGYCDEHRRAHLRAVDRQRGSRQTRGYGVQHTRLRARWAPRVAAGVVDCHAEQCVMPARLILPGMPWDLGHAPDRRGWTGPEHARCNRRTGGQAAHAN